MLRLQAFSLIELLIVLFIITILAALGFPSLRGYLNHTDDQLLQQHIVQIIRFAQQEANANDALVTLSIGKEWLVAIDGKVLYRAAIKPQAGRLHWRSYPSYREYLSFYPQDQANTDNATYWYCEYQQTTPKWSIAMSKSGQTQIMRPDSVKEIRDSRGRPLSCDF